MESKPPVAKPAPAVTEMPPEPKLEKTEPQLTECKLILKYLLLLLYFFAYQTEFPVVFLPVLENIIQRTLVQDNSHALNDVIVNDIKENL